MTLEKGYLDQFLMVQISRTPSNNVASSHIKNTDLPPELVFMTGLEGVCADDDDYDDDDCRMPISNAVSLHALQSTLCK